MSEAVDGERLELRQRILDRATRLFAEKGFSATSVRELALACDCTKPALYYYFESKENLFREVVQLHVAEMNQMIERWTSAPTGDLRELVHTAIDAFLEHVEGSPDGMRLLQRIETQPEQGAPDLNMMAARELHLSLLSELITHGIAAGEIRAGVDPIECALIIAGTVSFQMEIALAKGSWDRARLHRTLDIIFDGIAP
jgi:AcrR family transcriptional regulator